MNNLQSFSIKQKLATGFLLIVLINGITGWLGVGVIRELGALVKKTYDQALMSGTFALAAKYDFSEMNVEIHNALAATNEKDLKLHLRRAKKFKTTLKEDLDVYQERAIKQADLEKVKKVLSLLPEIQKQVDLLIEKKLAELSSGKSVSSVELINIWSDTPELRVTTKELTALYDEAAEDGYAFRLDSEDRISKNTKTTLFVLGTCLLLSLILSILLSYLIITPLMKMKFVCGKIADGNFGVRAEVNSKDEFGTLATSFNIMLDNIEEKTESMSSLLSNIPFALFYFNEEGRISSERSLSTDKIFPHFSESKMLEQFFQRYVGNYSQTESVMKAMFQNLIPFSSAAYLLPQVIVLSENGSERIVHLSYRPKRDQKKKLEKVIVLGEDITEKEKAKRKSSELMERVDRISKVSSDMQGFNEFLPTVRQMLAHTSASIELNRTEEFSNIKRDLHSIKGLLGIYSFSTVALMVHDLENKFSGEVQSFDEETVLKIKDIIREFSLQSDDLIKLLALNTENDFRLYDQKKIEKLKSLVKASNKPEIHKLFDELDRFPIEKVFAKYSTYAESLVKKLEDKKISIEFGQSDEVSYEEIQRLDAILIHVLNNSIDHGIESSSERGLLNKNESGTVRITCVRNEDEALIIRISDDGKGIDGEYLLQKAIKSGMLLADVELSDEEKTNLIFKSGLSSRSETSVVSGRGIGMDAVKAQIEAIGGSIRLYTQIGIGTTFEFFIPPQTSQQKGI